MRNIFINVEPRYSAGSPAAIYDEKLALRIAADERNGYQHALEGLCGDAEKAKAEKLGLGLIVFIMKEKSNAWEVHDLITNDRFVWPFKARCPKCKKNGIACKRGVIDEHTWIVSHHGGPCPGIGTNVAVKQERYEP